MIQEINGVNKATGRWQGEDWHEQWSRLLIPASGREATIGSGASASGNFSSSSPEPLGVGHIDAFGAPVDRKRPRAARRCNVARKCRRNIRRRCRQPCQHSRTSRACDLRIFGAQLSLIPQLPKESCRHGLYKYRFTWCLIPSRYNRTWKDNGL